MSTIKILVTLLFVSSSILSFSQTSTEEKESQTLRAKLKVKSITLMQSDFGYTNGKWVAGTPYKLGKTKFDKKGDEIEEITNNKRGTIETWVVTEYDSKGNYSKMVNKEADGKVSYITKFKSEYDSIGRLKYLTAYQKDTVPTHRIGYSYDSKGNISVLRTSKAGISFRDQSDQDGYFNGKFNPMSYSESVYDDKGRTIKTSYYNSNDFLGGQYTGKEEFTYDERGKLIEKTSDYHYVYKYGANGLQSEYTVYDNKNKPLYTVKSVYEFNP